MGRKKPVIAYVWTIAFTGAVLFSDVVPIGDWTKLTAVGVLGAILAMLIMYTFPKIMDAQTDQIKNITETHTGAFKSLETKLDELRHSLENSQDAQLQLLREVVFQKKPREGP